MLSAKAKFLENSKINQEQTSYLLGNFKIFSLMESKRKGKVSGLESESLGCSNHPLSFYPFLHLSGLQFPYL